MMQKNKSNLGWHHLWIWIIPQLFHHSWISHQILFLFFGLAAQPPLFFASAFPSTCSNKTALTKTFGAKNWQFRLVNYTNPLWLYQGVGLANQPPKSWQSFFVQSEPSKHPHESADPIHTDAFCTFWKCDMPWHEEIHPREIQNFPLIGKSYSC